MSDPYVSQITICGFNYAPKHYAKCDGQSMAISGFPTLFALLGVAYGGDGVTNFNLPDLRGRTPVSVGTSFDMHYARGQKGGVENVTLSPLELPGHNHVVQCDTVSASTIGPNTNRILAESAIDLYAEPTNLVSLSPQSVSSFGSGGSHTNMQPYTVLNFCIALAGNFPSRN